VQLAGSQSSKALFGDVMGNCCHKDTKYATYKKELGAPLLKELKLKGLPEGEDCHSFESTRR
jgi:hypothetical protein